MLFNIVLLDQQTHTLLWRYSVGAAPPSPGRSHLYVPSPPPAKEKPKLITATRTTTQMSTNEALETSAVFNKEPEETVKSTNEDMETSGGFSEESEETDKEDDEFISLDHDAIYNQPVPSSDQILNPGGIKQVSNQGGIQQIPNQGDTQVLLPKVGMRFKSLKDAKVYYRLYGKQEGFSIRTRNTHKRGRGDLVTVCDLVCSREGNPPILKENGVRQVKKRNTSTSRCQCKARIKLVLQDDNSWLVKFFDKQHNHGLVSPVKTPMLRSVKHVPEVARMLSEQFSELNLPVGKVASIFDCETFGFTERDCYNHLNSKVKNYKTPKDGDATAAYNYFKKKSVEDPQFFYAIQSDDEGRAVNFFWVDGRCRNQYQHFGDVVSFDTTYRTNIYAMPFGPFTGINHHFQSIQFGCALLLDETEESFVWLFETWLAAMGNRPPVSILTDQDRAMTAAVRRVFPNTKHRFCLWHVTMKFPDHLAHAYKKRSEFAGEMNKCIRSTYNANEFEVMWGEVLQKNDLLENDWLKGLYEIREQWVPVYFLNTFFGGQNTTGRSESMNSLYKEFFPPDCNLQKFVHQNERCLKKIVRNERREDYESEHKDRIVGESQYLLRNAGKVYTRNVFTKFKDQWDRALHYKIEKEEPGDDFTSYAMKSRKKDASRIWKVDFNRRTLQGTCQCKMFEFIGIPCRHLAKLFLHFDIDELPEHFVLRRWTKRANSYRVLDKVVLVTSAENSRLLRLTHGTYLANQVICDAAGDNEKYTMMVEAMTSLVEKFALLDVTREEAIALSKNSNLVNGEVMPSSNNPDIVIEEPTPSSKNSDNVIEEASNTVNKDSMPSSKNSESVTEAFDTVIKEPMPSNNDAISQVSFLDPNISRTKGRKKASNSRFKRPIEISQEKEHRTCTGCGKKVNHNIRTCPMNPNSSKKTKKD